MILKKVYLKFLQAIKSLAKGKKILPGAHKLSLLQDSKSTCVFCSFSPNFFTLVKKLRQMVLKGKLSIYLSKI